MIVCQLLSPNNVRCNNALKLSLVALPRVQRLYLLLHTVRGARHCRRLRTCDHKHPTQKKEIVLM